MGLTDAVEPYAPIARLQLLLLKNCEHCLPNLVFQRLLLRTMGHVLLVLSLKISCHVMESSTSPQLPTTQPQMGWLNVRSS